MRSAPFDQGFFCPHGTHAVPIALQTQFQMEHFLTEAFSAVVQYVIQPLVVAWFKKRLAAHKRTRKH
jgi:hypothetical protein